MFFLEQKENLLQISPVPHRSNFFNFLFQIVKWGNFAETLIFLGFNLYFQAQGYRDNRDFLSIVAREIEGIHKIRVIRGSQVK